MGKIIDKKVVEILTTPGAPFQTILSMHLGNEYDEIDDTTILSGTITFRIWSRTVTGDLTGSSASTGSYKTAVVDFNRDFNGGGVIQRMSGSSFAPITLTHVAGSATVLSPTIQQSGTINLNEINIAILGGTFVTSNGNDVEHMIQIDIEITTG